LLDADDLGRQAVLGEGPAMRDRYLLKLFHDPTRARGCRRPQP
jgi:hypothetical protein